jgi:hypothetical protein
MLFIPYEQVDVQIVTSIDCPNYGKIRAIGKIAIELENRMNR